MEENLKISEIFERIKRSIGLKNDTELANELGLNLNTLYSWKNRNHFDVNLIYNLCKKRKINLAWVLTGEVNYDSSSGDKYSVSEDIQKYEVKIYELEKELKKTDAECGTDTKELARLNSEITELRAKLEFANVMIDKLIKQH